MTEQDRIAEFGDLWRNYTDEDFDALIVGNTNLLKFLSKGFFTAPASTKYHGAYEGGLYDHSKNVFLRLKDLTEKNDLHWQRPISPFIIGMFHDLCKCDQYKKVDKFTQVELPDGTMSLAPLKTTAYEYNTNTLLKGHGSKSVMLLSQFMTLTEEEMLCIRYHMGAYEKEEWAEFDAAIKRYENVFWTHAADMLASKIDEE